MAQGLGLAGLPEAEMVRVVAEAMEHANLGFAVSVDDAGQPRLLYANEAASRILGYSREELLERNPLMNLAPEDRAQMVKQRERFYRQGATGLPPSYELTIQRKDGTRVPIEVGIARISVGGKLATVSFFQDISARRSMQAQLAQVERMATVGTLAAGIAHEINNPLTYVLLHLRTLERDLPGAIPDARTREKLMEIASEAAQGANRVGSIVRDLLSFARSDDTERRSVDVASVLEWALKVTASQLRHRGQLVRDIRPAPPVRANEGRLGQVFLNLLVNAIQALPEDRTAQNRIEVAVRPEADGVIVEIRDNGTGMPADVQDRIFDPFFSTKPVGRGTGLGLSICRNLVDELGGCLTFTSTPGQGTTFRVSLPAEKQNAGSPVDDPAQ